MVHIVQIQALGIDQVHPKTKGAMRMINKSRGKVLHFQYPQP